MRRPAAALILIASLLCVPFATTVFAGQFEDAKKAYERGDYKTAYRLFKPLAEKGDPAAHWWLGLLYTFGQGVQKDHAEGAKWYKTSYQLFKPLAEKGDPEAQFHLGLMNYNAQGVQLDYGEAEKWFRRAAEQGNATAMVYLASLYRNIIRDYVQAHMWYNLAASMFPPSDVNPRVAAAGNRDIVASMMTPAQIAEAERLAREWKPKKEK